MDAVEKNTPQGKEAETDALRREIEMWRYVMEFAKSLRAYMPPILSNEGMQRPAPELHAKTST